jgi:catechol 2,3-dioxygenase-like lactoylglutathione lyase family enzyme|tara:strand:+ start:825 stop:1253 length:429 start_codon:yes stop_codon:yes gene_type:complete
MVKLRHVGLAVTDMDKSLQLYEGIFGLDIVWDQIETGKFIDRLSKLSDVQVRTVKLKDISGGMIELLQYLSHPSNVTQDPINRIGCSHIAITVDNIDYMYNTLINYGLEFHYQPQLSDDGNAKVAFCRDLEGILIEVVEQVK